MSHPNLESAASNVGMPTTTCVYYRARYYEPGTGRFISEDPITFSAAEANFYVYVKNNPVRWTDPSGLKVYRCRRRADLPLNVFNLEHWWIKTDTKEVGLGIWGGGVPGQNQAGEPSGYPGVPTSMNDHTGQSLAPNAVCEEVPDEDENCVNKELNTIGSYEGPFMIPPWNNCQVKVTNILNKCKVLPKPKLPVPVVVPPPATPHGSLQ